MVKEPLSFCRHLQTAETIGKFMLKASEVKLMDGQTYTDVDIIPSDDGFVIIQDEVVIQILHHAVASISYTDSGSAHFARGRALAMYYDDAEKIREILEEFGYELEELAKFINESLENPETTGNEEDSEKGDNPYE